LGETRQVDGKNVEKINCFQCVYFAVTWEPAFPKTCRLFGFKSVAMPSATVYETTGTACMGFVKKPAKNEKTGEGAQ